VLLRLSLLFPDRAPDRLRLSLQAGSTRELVRAGAADAPAGEAARTVLALLARTARHDRSTRRHTERVRAYVDLLAEALHLPAADRERLRWAALVHDVGKTSVDARVLRKPSRLDEDEWRQVREHPAEGARLAQPLRPFLGEWFDAIGQHHERWDGTGYPLGLVGEQISRGARIVAVADALEVMTGHRSYQRPVDPGAARAELARCSGTQFDPAVVRVLLGISLGSLRRVLGPAAWFGTVGVTARSDPDAVARAGSDVDLPDSPPDAGVDELLLSAVGLHPAAALWSGTSTHAAAVPTGNDAGGGSKLTGHADAGTSGPTSGPEQR
jgi:putative nucleotidyltransferase with HDIG domain